MSEGIIPGPNFKFQTRERYWPGMTEKDRAWSEWTDVDAKDTIGPRIIEEDGHLVLDNMGGSDEYVHQVRIVFLPED